MKMYRSFIQMMLIMLVGSISIISCNTNNNKKEDTHKDKKNPEEIIQTQPACKLISQSLVLNDKKIIHLNYHFLKFQLYFFIKCISNMP